MNKVKRLIEALKIYLVYNKALKRFHLLSSEEIEVYQFQKLKKTIINAWNNVPFYRKLWKKSGFNPSQFNSLKDLQRLPIIDRNDIINNLNDFIPDNYDKNKLSLVTTGGTSGMPMKFYIDNYIARAKEIAFLTYGYRFFANIFPFEKVAIFRGLRVKDTLIQRHCFWRFSYAQRGLVFSPFHLTKTNFPYYIAKLRSYKPSIIRAYPSTIVELCILMKDANEPPIKSLKKVICSSENIYQWQRDLVSQVLGVEIWSLYGHSEKCVIGFQIIKNRTLFHPFYGITEFMSSNFTSPSIGEIGEIIVTGFDHDYFPLIRYRTNDLVRVWKADSHSEMIADTIIGREQDFVIDNHGNKIQFTNQDEPFWELEGIIAYQYFQEKEGELILKLQTDKNYDLKNDQKLLSEVTKIFIDFKIKIIHVENIKKTPRGKFPYLVQSISRN